MKTSRRFLFLLSVSLWALCLPPAAVGLDLGIHTEGEGGGPKKVQIVEQPVDVVEVQTDEVRFIHDIRIDPGQDFKSAYFDVRGYNFITLYVLPLAQEFGEDVTQTVQYQLDAYFSLDNTAKIDYIQFGGVKTENFGHSWQSLGSVVATNGEEDILETKLTTGSTSHRSLHAAIAGPFMRLVLRNFSKDKTRSFKIGAYLTKQ